VVVDLDGTLTVDDPTVGYPDKAMDERVASAVHAARGAGYGVMVLTARGMRTWKSDRALVERHVRPGVERWLELKGVSPDQLHVAKPWCGPGGFYVDDRNLHVEEFVFRFSGPFASRPVRVVVEGGRTLAPPEISRLLRIERWLDVCSWSGLGRHDRADGRGPALELSVAAEGSIPNVAGWFALHAEDAMSVPLEVSHRDGSWRLRPTPGSG
jgi:capsule biosynthesis phosphatase